MAAFGSQQGGKAAANESKPKQGDNGGASEAPKGDLKMGQVPKGVGGSDCGFGC